jgi:hypothetical protein
MDARKIAFWQEYGYSGKPFQWNDKELKVQPLRGIVFWNTNYSTVP